MKIQKVIKRDTSYPIKPIIFTAVAIVSINGCSGEMRTLHKPLKPMPEINHIDKNSTINIEAVTPGMMPVAEAPR